MASLMRETHPLTLKVMRLSRPALADTRQFPLDSTTTAMAQALQEAEQNRPTQSGQVFSDLCLPSDVRPLDGFPLSEALVLPRAFGTMYLGETFTAHLCLCNESSLVVRDIRMHAAMQTATQKLPLFDNSSTSNNNNNNSNSTKGAGQQEEALKQLQAGQPFNLQVMHEIKELGVHILGCTISYLSAQGERRTLQKSFKFQVSNPLVVKTKVNHLENDVLLEIQVHNATQNNMALERLRFEAASPFDAEDLNTVNGNVPVWSGSLGFMQPGDVRQYLYRLRPQLPTGHITVEQERAIKYASALGRLDIVWRSAFGSVGRLQTSQLLRKSPGMFLIEVEDALVHGKEKSIVSLEEPFVVRVRVRNVSEQSMAVSAVLQTQKHPMVISCGAAQRSLGTIAVGETKEMSIGYVSLASGVQRIGAMVLSDSLSGYTRDVGHLLDILVAS
ncbi:hypothetical protein IW140_000929 [Coemansia sp. RSA 1813]|nr:hypothetical protein EV178_001350 [Coemansia sp. RSA 1646]KAJ1772898.1 hypothetical protein LPJ74_001036 [Coemansia sp. RSA 1843]KAJ2093470.1 hypothetical protein IW138_000320 [Coemansia sp. RSA 986]KAJ2217279.1 hypothetical protein EV179_000746 [Coemansia sp. RSA 487]KAJ2572478.1 hypothetical protein IW140_000929 [Coemansia sp. RSA 1813]